MGLYLFSFLVLPVLVLFALEAFTRIVYPGLNHQDIDWYVVTHFFVRT